MRWKYFSRWNCTEYDNVRYITCKSLYKDTKDKSTKDEKNTKDKNTKDKILKQKIQKIKLQKINSKVTNEYEKTQDKQLEGI